MKSKYINLITDAWIRAKYKRTFIIGATIFAISFSIFVFLFLNYNIKSLTSNIESKMGADFMIIPKGEKKQNEGILLSGNPASFYMDKSIEELVTNVEGVEESSSQIFVTTLAAGCCAFPVQAIGMDFEKDFTIQHWMINKNLDVGYNEIIAGANIRIEEGSELEFFNTNYKIVGKLKSTGIGFDNTIFMTKQTALDMIKKLPIKTENDNAENKISAVLVKIKDSKNFDEVYVNLIKATKDYDVEIVKSKDFIKEFFAYLSQMLKIITILFSILVLFMIITIYSMMKIDAKDKNRDLSSLRIMGLSYKCCKKISQKYILSISLASSTLGVFFAFLVINLFVLSITENLGINFIPWDVLDQILTAISILLAINILVFVMQASNVNLKNNDTIIKTLRSEE